MSGTKTASTSTINSLENLMISMGEKAREAARTMATIPASQKNAALNHAANLIRDNRVPLICANEKDVKKAEEKGLNAALIDRLTLNPERLEAIAGSLEAIAEQEDPIGKELARWQRPNGLDIARIAVPLGVIGVIYESRPNVTMDAAALCLKAGNAVILRGGSEAVESNRALYDIFTEALSMTGLPSYAVQLVPTQDRAAVGLMLSTPGLVDVIVPRGGKSLVARIEKEARVPVFAHLDGICHLFLDREADMGKALQIIVNAKMRRPGICGALETLLVDAPCIEKLTPILNALHAKGCRLKGDETIRAFHKTLEPATPEDWDTEYLDAILSIKAVNGLREALDHIDRHSSRHTDGIITENIDTAEEFLEQVDSAICMVNSSTQFADGGEFGMGAEIGIATGRFHARGPVGADQLTTYKYKVRGTGQTRP